MTMQTAIRILFVGRRSQTAEELNRICSDPSLCSPDDRIDDSFALEFRMVTNQRSALALFNSDPPHIILMELNAQPNSRIRFQEMVRYRLPTAAVIAVGRHAPDKPAAFDAYLPVPLQGNEVCRLIRRICVDAEGYHLKKGDVTLNIATRTVLTPNGHYHMTPKQCMLLQMLMQRNGEVVARQELMRVIWNTSFVEDTRTLDVHVRWLRERIEDDPSQPKYLLTVRGVGYQLNL